MMKRAFLAALACVALELAALPAAAQTRLLATGPVHYCVRQADGSNANTGVAPNCWASLDHAAAMICKTLDLGGAGAVIWLYGRATGTFSPCEYVGGSWPSTMMVVAGATADAEIYAPDNGTGKNVGVLAAINSRPWVFRGLGISAPGGIAVESDNGTKVVLDGIWYGCSRVLALALLGGGVLHANNDFAITCSLETAFFAQDAGSNIAVQPGHQVYIPNAVSWSGQFAYAADGGKVTLNGLSFNVAPGVPGPTGKPWTVEYNGTLSLGGAGIPATVYGTPAPGAVGATGGVVH